MSILLKFHREKYGSGYIATHGNLTYRCHEDADLQRHRSAWIASVQDNDPICNDTDEAAPFVQINYVSTYAGAKELCQEHAEKNK